MAVMPPGDDARPEPLLSGRSQIAGAAGATLLAGAVMFVLFSNAAFGLDPANLMTDVALIALIAALAVLPARRAAAGILALAVVWLAGYAVYSLIPDWIELPVPVSEAVGGAAFYMSSYVDQQVAGALLVVAVLAAVIAITVLAGRRERDAPAETEDAGGAHGTQAGAVDTVSAAQPGRAPRRVVLLAIGLGALVALTLLPDLHKTLIEGTRGPLPAGWDDANLISWEAFQQRGLMPMKDYWYPYGAMWLLTDFPTGPGARWLWQAGVLAAAGWALWRLAGPKPVRIALCLLTFVAVGGFDVIDTLRVPFVWRYLPALVVAACYAAVGPLRHHRLSGGHLVFAAVCAAVGAMEADILIAGLGGAAFVGLGELVFEPALRTWRTLRAALVDLLPVAIAIGFVLAFWALTHSFSENLHWFTSFRAVSASSAAFQEQFGALIGLTAHPSHVTLFLTIPALTIVVAFAQRRFGGVAGTASSQLLFAAAGVSTVILAKHLVRPQGPLTMLIPLVALSWVAILHWQARAMRTAIAAGVLVGTLLGTLQAIATVKPTRYFVRALATPVRAVQDLGLVLDRGKVHAAGNGRFAPERFNSIPEKTVIADKLASGLSGTGDHRFATLGDAQILYVLFGQRPPRYISLYDTSAVSAQDEWVDEMRELDPKLLIWRRDLAVDTVPYAVRNPLVFAYAISNYLLQAQSDPMDVLRRRKPGERIDPRYWRLRLGASVDLGGIPSYSRGDDLERCVSGPGCAPYAILTRAGAARVPKVAVEVAGTPYSVSVSSREGVDSYAIRLDRLWFWPFSRGAQRLTVSAPGWKVERVGVQAGGDLY